MMQEVSSFVFLLTFFLFFFINAIFFCPPKHMRSSTSEPGKDCTEFRIGIVMVQARRQTVFS